MKIQTGQGTIPLITLIGIFSISALNALPGLAVSPILGDLNKIFPSATDLEIQMLSSLPSLLIIPFILLSGKLTEKVNNLLLLQVGLTIFGVSGILYLLSGKMWQLIAISAMLGIGSGLIVPLSTGLISRYFVGGYRTRQFGYSSAITNITLVLATTLTGYLAEENWHLPFLVYLFPFISIFLTYYLKKDLSGYHPLFPFISIFLTYYLKKDLSGYHPKDDVPVSTAKEMGKRGIDVKALVKLMAFYGLATYLVIIVSFNLPFLMEEYGLSSGRAGILISLFFLAIMAPGFVLNKIVQMLGRRIYMICLLLIACGMGIILVSRSEILIALGCILNGLAYGIIQPLIYDKTSDVAVPHKVTLALAFVMAMNYVAILLCPFIVNIAQNLFHSHSYTFAFWLNLMIALMAMFIVMKQEKLEF